MYTINIEFDQFDSDLFHTIQNHDMVNISDIGIYHTVVIDGIKVGIVGYIPSKDNQYTGFIQIAIKEEYRGKGILKESEDMLAYRYNLKTLYATINKNNIASIKAHEKAGFSLLLDTDISELRRDSKLKEDDIRLIKRYN